MKKTILKSGYNLKVFNDGSSAYIWTHPWKNWILLSSKDILTDSRWNNTLNLKKSDLENSHIKQYTKNINKNKK